MIPVVSFPNASTQPWAMMVKSFNANPTDTAMTRSWRSVYITSPTKLYFKRMSFRNHNIRASARDNNSFILRN